MEYIMQNTILSELECNRVMAPLRLLCKHKMGFGSSFNNDVIYHPRLYNINDLFPHQLSVQWSLFNTQLNNSSTLHDLSRISLFHLFNKYWVPSTNVLVNTIQ